MKVVVTGPTRAGKSTLIKKICGGKSISIDKHGTTVALDHGIAYISGIKVFLFGTPGLEHFSVLRRILAAGADGIIFTIDSANRALDPLAKRIWREISVLAPNVPCVVAANKQDLPEARSVAELKNDLPFLSGISIVPISAKNNGNLDLLMKTILMLMISKLKPLLKKIEHYSGISNGVSRLAEALGIDLKKARNYVLWLEFRDLIEVDWINNVFYMKEGLKNVLSQQDSTLPLR
ncbi:MAG: GTP-binding protein [Candidatus Odinarchaeia archaeon]